SEVGSARRAILFVLVVNKCLRRCAIGRISTACEARLLLLQRGSSAVRKGGVLGSARVAAPPSWRANEPPARADGHCPGGRGRGGGGRCPAGGVPRGWG